MGVTWLRVANIAKTMYVGVTTDLERRVWEHKNKTNEGFTKRYDLTRLVYIAEFSDINDAIAWEKSLKGKSRAKKLGLVEEQQCSQEQAKYKGQHHRLKWLLV